MTNFTRVFAVWIMMGSFAGVAFGQAPERAEKNDSLTTEDKLDTIITEIIIAPDDPVLEMLDKLLTDKYTSFHYLETDTQKLNTHQFPADSVPVYSDAVYRERLALLNEQTPFNLDYNSNVKAFINLYTVKKRELSSRLLGLSQVYFPMFDEMLDKHGLPLELKHLAIVESALNPSARSRAGAVGLWQFMYNTGKIYGLTATSYVDDRMDPYKSTEAACKYLKFLHSIYDNWELALAAYNCGPGNINKAIRRSGGKRGYWELWPYLPRETRGYVPAFIAVNYMMNYASEHNLYPIEPTTTWFEFDTVHVNQTVTFDQLSAVLEIDQELIAYLNPIYKKGIIPAAKHPQPVYLPTDKTGLFLQNEQLVYEYGKEEEEEEEEEDLLVKEQVRKIHTVRSGEYLGAIANRYRCSVNDIKDWNGLRTTRIRPNQKLVVYVTEQVPAKTASSSKPAPTPSVKEGNYEYYTIQEGDTLWDIARSRGVSVSQLEQLNKHLNVKRLKPGSKIIVGAS